MNKNKKNKKFNSFVLIAIFSTLFFLLFYFIFLFIDGTNNFSYLNLNKDSLKYVNSGNINEATQHYKKDIPAHLKTPDNVKAIYITSWVAGSPSIRDKIVSLIKDTELNSIVIDIKDYSGKVFLPIKDERVLKYNSVENRIPDIKDFIKKLHTDGIYVIGRVTVFQDPNLTKVRPDLAIKKTDGSVWKDFKGLSFTDPGFKEVWDYHIAIAENAYNLGFDEINFDYIRYPSDGNMSDIYYPASEKMILDNPNTGKSMVLENFFEYLSKELKNKNIVISADLFGMTTVSDHDLNIGQIFEIALPYFDYIAPMVYPSHYPEMFIGIKNPAEYPYDVVKYSIEEAINKTTSSTTIIKTKYGKLVSNPTSTPVLYSKDIFSLKKIRPWLQDFDLGATYTPDRVRAQIQALNDLGIESWMLWSPSNIYTKEALLPFYISTSTVKTEQN